MSPLVEKKSSWWPLILLSVILVSLWIALLAIPAWVIQYGKPNLKHHQGLTGTELANIHWGEYRLPLTELTITEADTVEPLLRATAQVNQAEGDERPFSVPIRATEDLRPALKSLGWNLQVAQAGPIPLVAGRRYKVDVRGDNGWGHFANTSAVIVPD